MSQHGRTPTETTGSAQAAMSRVARGSVANLTGAVVSGMATFALSIVVTRGLTTSAAGVFFSTTSLLLLAISVGQLGTDTGLVYFLARCRALGRPNLIPAYVRAAVLPVMILAIAMGVGMLIMAPQLAALTNPGYEQLATDYLRVFAVIIPFAVLETIWLSATRGLGTMRPYTVVEQISRPVIQLCLVFLVVTVPAAAWLGAAWCVPYALAAGAAWLWWKRIRPTPQKMATTQPGRAGEFWRFSAPRSLASVAQLAMQRFDIILVGAIAGVASAAVYAAATRFIVAGQMSKNAISLAIQPQLAAGLARGEHAATNHLYQYSTAWLILVTWPIYLVLAVFGNQFLRIFGESYSAGSMVLLLLSLSMLLASGLGNVDVVLVMAGRTTWSLANVALAFAVNLGLDLWLIPLHGITGAAIGWAVAIVVKNVAALAQVALALRLHPFGRSTLVAVLLSLGAYALLPGLSRFLIGNDIVSLIISLIVGTVAFVVGLWFFRGALHLTALRGIRSRRQPASG